MATRDVRRWRKVVRPRARDLIEWMQARNGPVTLCDDDAAAIAELVRWLENDNPYWFLMLFLLLGGDD